MSTRLSKRRFSLGAAHWLKLTWAKMQCWQSLAQRFSPYVSMPASDIYDPTMLCGYLHLLVAVSPMTFLRYPKPFLLRAPLLQSDASTRPPVPLGSPGLKGR